MKNRDFDESNGGRHRIRTYDLLRVKRACKKAEAACLLFSLIIPLIEYQWNYRHNFRLITDNVVFLGLFQS